MGVSCIQTGGETLKIGEFRCLHVIDRLNAVETFLWCFNSNVIPYQPRMTMLFTLYIQFLIFFC